MMRFLCCTCRVALMSPVDMNLFVVCVRVLAWSTALMGTECRVFSFVWMLWIPHCFLSVCAWGTRETMNLWVLLYVLLLGVLMGTDKRITKRK
jgi:hypothetical protein